MTPESKRTNRARDSRFMIASGVVLTAALIGGLSMLLRAREMHTEVAAEDSRVALEDRHAQLRGELAEVTAFNVLIAFPRQQKSLDGFRAALTAAAEHFSRDPLSGNENAGPFACEAVEFTAGAGQIRLWSSGLIDDGIRSWAIDSISDQLKSGTEGSRHVEETSRILGQSWAAFQVEGEVRIGGLIWITPRNTSVPAQR